MCTAAASWRVCTSRCRVSIAASNSDMMWLPDSVKIVLCPARSSVRMTMSAPRSKSLIVMRTLLRVWLDLGAGNHDRFGRHKPRLTLAFP